MTPRPSRVDEQMDHEDWIAAQGDSDDRPVEELPEKWEPYIHDPSNNPIDRGSYWANDDGYQR